MFLLYCAEDRKTKNLCRRKGQVRTIRRGSVGRVASLVNPLEQPDIGFHVAGHVRIVARQTGTPPPGPARIGPLAHTPRPGRNRWGDTQGYGCAGPPRRRWRHRSRPAGSGGAPDGTPGAVCRIGPGDRRTRPEPRRAERAAGRSAVISAGRLASHSSAAKRGMIECSFVKPAGRWTRAARRLADNPLPQAKLLDEVVDLGRLPCDAGRTR